MSDDYANALQKYMAERIARKAAEDERNSAHLFVTGTGVTKEKPADPCPECYPGGTCDTTTCGRKQSSELMAAYGMPDSRPKPGWTLIPPIPSAFEDDDNIAWASPMAGRHWFRFDFGSGDVGVIEVRIVPARIAPPAPLHPLQRLSSQPNGFGQSLWRPWE